MVRARTPLHGKTTLINHDGMGLFQGVPSPLTVGRYHSLCVQEEGLPSCMEVTARSEDGTIMGLRHRHFPIEGLQFHPESVLTEHGQDIMDNFVSSLERGDMIQTDRSVQANRFACEIIDQKMSDRDIAERLKEMACRGVSAEDLIGMISVFYPQCKRVSTKHPVGHGPVRDRGSPGADLQRQHHQLLRPGRGRCPGGQARKSFLEAGAAAALTCSRPWARTSRPARIGQSGCLTKSTSRSSSLRPITRPCAMRSRREGWLQCQTVFNVMGPLMNPVMGPRRQLMGVHSLALLDIVPQVLSTLGVDRAMVVHGQPGMDEVSPCGATQVAELRDGSVKRYELTLEELGLSPCQPASVNEMAPQAAARCCTDVLRGRRNERRDMVLINCACAFYAFGKTTSLASGLSLAEMTVDSGRAFAKMKEYVVASREAS